MASVKLQQGSSPVPRAGVLSGRAVIRFSRSRGCSPARKNITPTTQQGRDDDSPARNTVARSSRRATGRIGQNKQGPPSAHQVLFVPELLEIILYYLPSFQVLTAVRQVHPFFDSVVQTSPLLAWHTWTSRLPSPPEFPSNLSNPVIHKPRSSPPYRYNIDPPLEVCSILHPIISKWWETLARNTKNYDVFPLNSCVYNRIFPTDALNKIYFTRPPVHVDDLIIDFNSTYSFMTYGQHFGIGGVDDRRKGHYQIESDGEANGLLADRYVTVEGLLRRMWIPVTEHLGRWRKRKYGSTYKMRNGWYHERTTMKMVIKVKRNGQGDEMVAADVILNPLEPYDVRVDQYF